MPSFLAGVGPRRESGSRSAGLYVDPKAAERLFRHKVLRFLRREDLLSQERLELLLSWRHSGFSVHNDVRLPAGDTKALEVLVRYMSRPAVSLARLVLQPDSEAVLYFPKPQGQDGNAAGPERIDALEFVARVLAQIRRTRNRENIWSATTVTTRTLPVASVASWASQLRQRTQPLLTRRPPRSQT